MPPEPTPGTATPSRRRWPRALAFAATVAIVAVAVIAGPALLVDFAPASLRFGDGAPALAVDRFGGADGTYVVGYEHDQTMEMAVRLANSGPVGAEVTDVRLVAQSKPLLVHRPGVGPISVGVGDQEQFIVPVRFDNCEAYHEREAMLVDHVDVHVRVLGRTVVERVPLDRTLMARSPMLWQCPDRTIDRSDDLRMGSVR